MAFLTTIGNRLTHITTNLFGTGIHPKIDGEFAFEARNLCGWYGDTQTLFDINAKIRRGQVTALLGYSGSGKSTILGIMNHSNGMLWDLDQGNGVGSAKKFSYTGQMLLGDTEISRIHPMNIPRYVGMIMQKPLPFPTMSIFDNVVDYPLQLGLTTKKGARDYAEHYFKLAQLWNEVKDRLYDYPTILSGGQQQRLCIARALAPQPPFLVMDEPCSALDPDAKLEVEEVIGDLATQGQTIVLVTHDKDQAAHSSKYTIFIDKGRIVEEGPTDKILVTPETPQLERYLRKRNLPSRVAAS